MNVTSVNCDGVKLVPVMEELLEKLKELGYILPGTKFVELDITSKEPGAQVLSTLRASIDHLTYDDGSCTLYVKHLDPDSVAVKFISPRKLLEGLL